MTPVERLGRGLNVRHDGPPDQPVIVLVHGFSGSLNVWNDIVPTLAARHHVVRLDLAGHGATCGDAVDAPEQGRLVSDLLDELDLREVTLVGHSFGADVVLSAAAISDRVAAIGLLGQAPDYTGARFQAGNAVMTVPAVSTVLHRLAPERVVRSGGAWAFAPGFRPSRRVEDQAVADHRVMDPAMYRIILTVRRERLALHPLDAQVAGLGLPTLVVLGGADRFYGARSAGRYRASGARVVVLPHSGHSPHVEEPDTTAALIASLAAGVAG